MTTTKPILRLPSTFKSLYRTVLRAASASVLHHTSSTRILRANYRPVFDEAVVVLLQLHEVSSSSKSDEKQQQHLTDRIHKFNTRINNTLSLLHNSSEFRGLPHLLTRNIVQMHYHQKKYRESFIKTWNPHLPPDDEKYKINNINMVRRDAEKKLAKGVWGIVNEVGKMAESRQDLVLGSLEEKYRYGKRR